MKKNHYHVYTQQITDLIQLVTNNGTLTPSLKHNPDLILYLIINKAIENFKSKQLTLKKSISSHQQRLIKQLKPILQDYKAKLQQKDSVIDPYLFYKKIDKAIIAVNQPVDLNSSIRAFFINNDFGKLGNLLAAIINDQRFHPQRIYQKTIHSLSTENVNHLTDENSQLRATIQDLSRRLSVLENQPHQQLVNSNIKLSKHNKITYAKFQTGKKHCRFSLLFDQKQSITDFIRSINSHTEMDIDTKIKGKMLSFSIDNEFKDIVIYLISKYTKKPANNTNLTNN